MSRADRYILRQFIQTFLFGILAFVTIYLVVDLIENLDDFSDRNVPAPIVVKYYLYYIPEIIKLIVPISMLLAGLFTFSRLDSTHELTALRAAGRSMRRIALPLLGVGLLVGGTMIWFNGWVVPTTNKKHFDIRRHYLGRDIVGGTNNLNLRISPTLHLQMDYFNQEKGTANLVSLERLDSAARLVIPETVTERGEGIGRLPTDTIRTLAVVERIDAQQMVYDSTKKEWKMLNGIARNLSDPERVAATPFAERVIPGLPITPEELNLSQQKSDELTLQELRARIEQERLSGRDVRGLMIDYHSKFAFPFAAFIVVFFGIPFSSAQRKGGAAIPIALTALISAAYLVFTEVSKTLSFTADIPPVVTAWLANGIFLLIGLANLWRVEKG